MSSSSNPLSFRHSLTEKELTEILEAVEETGLYTTDDFLDTSTVNEWRSYAETQAGLDRFRESSIGAQGLKKNNSDIRSDKILWVDEFSGSTHSMGVWLRSLIAHLKDHFRVPLDDIEAHFSVYPPGARYQKHIDNGASRNHRLFTFIFYLNLEWRSGDGGELIIYDTHNTNLPVWKISPRGGTFVLFRSDLFYHEVMPSHKPRYAVTGWLRRHARV